jgi:hypothetical protein
LLTAKSLPDKLYIVSLAVERTCNEGLENKAVGRHRIKVTHVIISVKANIP